MISFVGYHQNLTCWARFTCSSNLVTTSSKLKLFCTSFRRKEGSTERVTDRTSPVAPRPHKLAKNKSTYSSREHVWRVPSARRRVSDTTDVEITPKRRPEPCVAVVITPASVCSEIEPTLLMARLCRSR